MIVEQIFSYIIIKYIIVFIVLYKSNYQVFFLPEEELTDKLRALCLLALSCPSPRAPSVLTPPTTNDIRTKGSIDKERESDKRTYPCITASEKDRLHCIFYYKDN